MKILNVLFIVFACLVDLAGLSLIVYVLYGWIKEDRRKMEKDKKPIKIDVAYLCDQGHHCAASGCISGSCRHTADINHAVHKDSLENRSFKLHKISDEHFMLIEKED